MLSAVLRVNVRCAQAVNFYGQLVKSRHAARDATKRKRWHWFNSHFYAQLMQADNRDDAGFSYASVKGWTNPRGRSYARVDIFGLDELMFPVHVGTVRVCCVVEGGGGGCALLCLCTIGCIAEPLGGNSRLYARKED